MKFGRAALFTASALALVAPAFAGPVIDLRARENDVAKRTPEDDMAVAKRTLPSIFNSLQSFALTESTVALTTESLTQFSFNNWGGFSSLNNFDSFFGRGNFDGRFNQINFIRQEEVISVLQCQSVFSVSIIEQYLSVLFEAMSELILTQVCEVEVQTIIIQQFSSRFSIFSEDIRRVSGRGVGFDSRIAGLLPNVASAFASRQFSDLGFAGSSIGSNLQFVSSNWNPSISPSRVGAAWRASQLATLPAALPQVTGQIF